MYVCGITPYDTTHLGHAFTYLSFDVLNRYLAATGNEVKYVQNVTDIDDDLLKKARETSRDWIELGTYWTNRFTDDMNALNILMPNPYVKATDSIPLILRTVEKLVDKGASYKAGDNVYFDISSYPEYGHLSGFDRDEMLKLSKERGADPTDPNKRDPLDFIIWQGKQEGEPFWESPFGPGRPGWHIECSSMVLDYLGEQIDVHGGGDDLIYPHHESEIAQSETYTGKKPFVNYWMHTGSVSYQGEKMSKSLGNLVMVSDLLKKYSPNTIRYLLLSHHYREPWEYVDSDINRAEKEMEILENVVSTVKSGEIVSEFINELGNDLNTPRALSVLSGKRPEDTRVSLELLGFVF